MTYEAFWQRLTPLYEPDEAKAIARWVLDACFGLSLADIYCGKVTELSEDDQAKLEKIVERLEKGEPIQYVLGTCSFCGHTFHVAPGVLIPRPETAELCEWIMEGEQQDTEVLVPRKVLDIGTGSGCIAITLALGIPNSDVEAWDISDTALGIARRNAEMLSADVRFINRDILKTEADDCKYDLIVSNPPYIDEETERDGMARNVLDYEPREALFAPQGTPDLFYQRICDYASKALSPGGRLYYELNPLTAEQVKQYAEQAGFIEVEIRRDQFGKNRFLKAIHI